MLVFFLITKRIKEQQKKIKINYKDAKEQTKNVNSLILHNKKQKK